MVKPVQCAGGHWLHDSHREPLPLQENGRDISPWHDIPLRNADGTLNFVCGEADTRWLPASCSALGGCATHCVMPVALTQFWAPPQFVGHACVWCILHSIRKCVCMRTNLGEWCHRDPEGHDGEAGGCNGTAFLSSAHAVGLQT